MQFLPTTVRAQVCELLGLVPSSVVHIEMDPHELTATLLAVNDDGEKYLNEAGLPATRTVRFQFQQPPSSKE